MVGRLVPRMHVRLTHERDRQERSDHRERDAEIERLRSEVVVTRDPACRQRGDRHRAIARCFVEPHRQTALGRADEIDLHDHRGGPCESLIDAEEHVGDDHPTPRRRPHQQQRYRQSDDPTSDEYWLASETIRQRSGEEVGERLDDAKGGDESERRGVRRESELLLRQQWNDRALLADHAAD